MTILSSSIRVSGVATFLSLAMLIASPLKSAEVPSNLLPILEEKDAIAHDLARPIAACVVREDTNHPAFHGCVDWHSAVHATWALIAFTRATGDTAYVELIKGVLEEEALDRERRLLRENPAFEMPYGRAWFLRLAIEYERAFDSDLLVSLADEVATSLREYYMRHVPEPFTRDYGNASWALINLYDYAEGRGDRATAQFVERQVREHFVTVGEPCPLRAEGSGFMAVCTNWAWIVSKFLEREMFVTWVSSFLPELPAPIVSPTTAHQSGMNFSRAWGLWELFSVTGSPQYANSFADNFLISFVDKRSWNGSYRVSHWVPQFGMFALMPLFGEKFRDGGAPE